MVPNPEPSKTLPPHCTPPLRRCCFLPEAFLGEEPVQYFLFLLLHLLTTIATSSVPDTPPTPGAWGLSLNKILKVVRTDICRVGEINKNKIENIDQMLSSPESLVHQRKPAVV